MRIFSGIRASGDKTLGNYSGGYRQYRATQEQGDAIFCIVDLHSITTTYEPEQLHEATLAGAAMLFATGIDPERSIVFAQSHVPAHAEAAWLLSSAAAFGELRRMTQFKDKSAEQEFVSAGLFNYPVLMAGDILLYQTNIVPVGDDQRQHIELARDIAQRFNQRYGETFTVPEGVFPDEGARIKNLQEPERLMSTSAGAPQGVVRMIDDPDTIRRRSRASRTSSRSCQSRQGSRFRTSRRGTTARGTARSRRTWPRRSSSCSRRSRSATSSCAPTTRKYAGCSPRVPRRQLRSPLRRWSACTTSWGS